MKFLTIVLALTATLPAFAFTPNVTPASAKVFFISPKDGATVSEKVNVEMGVTDMTIAQAGQDIDNKSKGHHHLIVDGAAIAAGNVVPADDHHYHYGKGQTSAEIILPKGDHSLTLQFADGAHRSYGEQLSSTIHVHVK